MLKRFRLLLLVLIIGCLVGTSMEPIDAKKKNKKISTPEVSQSAQTEDKANGSQTSGDNQSTQTKQKNKIQSVASDGNQPTQTTKTTKKKKKSQTPGQTESSLLVNNSKQIVENRTVYQQDKVGLYYLYVTVVNSLDDDMNTVRFSDINSYIYDSLNPSKKPLKAKVIVQEGSSQGPIPGGFQETGTIQVRGKSTTKAEQKSYKIKLDKGSNPWDGFSEINLNKHAFDLTRARNKLSFDYFKTIPNFTSLRTRFVCLRIKDTTSKRPDQKYVDYGLFTLIEEPDSHFLKTHGLDPKGDLYKASFFEFQRYPDNLKDKKDAGYSKEKFEEILEQKNGKSHQKILQMLDDVNNTNLSIEQIIEKHFNLDNLLTWLAVNLLLGNYDTNTQNFLLYSPSGSNIWYLMPWDFDGAWGYQDRVGKVKPQLPPWQLGITNYWGMELFNRIFRDPEYVKALTTKMQYLSSLINKERTTAMLQSYYPIVSRYVIQKPDIDKLPGGIDAFYFEYNRVAGETDQALNNYFESLEHPMPYFLGDPVINPDGVYFSWDASFSIQGNPLNYVFQLSKTPDFKTIIFEKRVKDIAITTGPLVAGTYYFRVVVYDSKGKSQVGFDEFVDSNQKRYFGVKEFKVN